MCVGLLISIGFIVERKETGVSKAENKMEERRKESIKREKITSKGIIYKKRTREGVPVGCKMKIIYVVRARLPPPP